MRIIIRNDGRFSDIKKLIFFQIFDIRKSFSSIIDYDSMYFYFKTQFFVSESRDVENFFSMSDIRSDKLRKCARPNENMPDRE